MAAGYRAPSGGRRHGHRTAGYRAAGYRAAGSQRGRSSQRVGHGAADSQQRGRSSQRVGHGAADSQQRGRSSQRVGHGAADSQQRGRSSQRAPCAGRRRRRHASGRVVRSRSRLCASGSRDCGPAVVNAPIVTAPSTCGPAVVNAPIVTAPSTSSTRCTTPPPGLWPLPVAICNTICHGHRRCPHLACD